MMFFIFLSVISNKRKRINNNQALTSGSKLNLQPKHHFESIGSESVKIPIKNV